MENIDLNIYLSRILSGTYIFTYRDETYKLKYPDMQIKYLAELYAEEEYNKNKYNDWIQEKDILNLLMSINMWTPKMEQELQEIPKTIEDYKVNLFKNSLNPNVCKNIRKSLSAQKKRLDFLFNIRHCLDHITVKGYANLSKSHFLLSQSFYSKDDNKIFPNHKNIDFVLFNNLSAKITENTIPAHIFRQIARSDIWRNYWVANKENIFGKPTIDWTDEQKTLIALSKMYDNAYEHLDCPSDNIIEDDDMFDGWMISIRRESEKDKNKRRNEKMFGDKLNKAGEIFLVAKSKEEANNIYDMNNSISRNIIKERERVIANSESPVKENDMPDVQRNLKMQQVQMSRERVKRK